MWIVRSIQQHLDGLNISHKLVELPPFFNLREAQKLGKLPDDGVLQSILLHDKFGLIMAIIPANHRLNLSHLKHILKRELSLVNHDQHTRIFKGITPEFTPPIGDSFGIKTIIAEEISHLKEVYFACGDNSHLLVSPLQDFLLLQKNASFLDQISSPESTEPDSTASTDPADANLSHYNLRQRLNNIDQLPAMPNMAQRILQLNANPYAHVDDLVTIVGQDPSLTAQIMRYASSPLYGYGSRITSLDIAVRMLGYDLVTNLALGIAVSKPFRIQRQGRIGLHHYWRNAIHSSALMQAFSKELPKELRPKPGLAYLCGLLHNFGYLLMGHLFPEDFNRLIQQYEKNTKSTVMAMELEVFGFNHAQLGAELLKQWNLPDEIVACAGEHHSERYHGPFANYVRLMHITDEALERYGLGMEEAKPNHTLSQHLLQSLQLTEETVISATEHILRESGPLNAMAQQLAA